MKRTIILITIVTLVAAAGSMVWAGPGRGAGRGAGGPGGYGNYECPKWGGAAANLSEEQQKQLEAERTAFFEATKDLHRQMQAKRLELKSVLIQKEIDVEKAKALQAEISKLQADLGLKRIDHIVNLRKIDPDLQAGMGRGFGGRGWGRHHGRGMGFGPMGQGPGPMGQGQGRFGNGGCDGYFQGPGPRGGWNY